MPRRPPLTLLLIPHTPPARILGTRRIPRNQAVFAVTTTTDLAPGRRPPMRRTAPKSNNERGPASVRSAAGPGLEQEGTVYHAVMPWGRHRGRRLADLPGSYLKWVLNADAAQPWLREQVKAELANRGTRFVPAALVLRDVEECLVEAVCEDDELSTTIAGIVSDHIMEALAAIRVRHDIGPETQFVITARGER